MKLAPFASHGLLLVALATVACSGQQSEPLTASSAGQPGYATRYPDELLRSRERFTEYEASARATMEALPSYPDELSDPDYAVVLSIVETADEAGRSDAYATRFAQSEAVDRFFEEEKDKLGQQVGGSVRYAAKQKGASEEIVNATGGAAVHGLDKAVAKQLEERMRAHNEAHALIEEHAEALGKANVEKLERQVDEISRASYLTHVAVTEERRSLERRVAEASDVRATLDRVIEESRARAADESRNDKERALAEKRMTAAQSARNRLDAELSEAERALSEMEQRAQQLQEDYSKAIDALKQKLSTLADSKSQATN